MDYRVIVASDVTGGSEYVIFLESDDVSNAEDHLLEDHTIDADEICECELPDGFPIDYRLQRQ